MVKAQTYPLEGIPGNDDPNSAVGFFQINSCHNTLARYVEIDANESSTVTVGGIDSDPTTKTYTDVVIQDVSDAT